MTRALIILILSIAATDHTTAAEKPAAPPLPPVLYNLTVNHDASSASLKWTASPSPGVTGYVVYRFRNNEGYAIDTLWNPPVLTYTDGETGALYFSEAYVVAAIDNDLNISPLSNAVSTIYLTGTLDTCNNKISLSWTGYNVQGTDLDRYDIYASADGGEFIQINSIHPDTTEFNWFSFDLLINYRFKVKAVLSDNSFSESNHLTIQTDIPRPPAWIEIMHIDASSVSGIEIAVSYDPDTDIDEFNILRKETGGGEFTLLATLNSTGGSFLYSDPSASSARRYLYRLDAVNRCGKSVISSIPAGNIVLRIESADNLITLQWNPYIGWPDGPFEYNMLWKNDDTFESLQHLPPSDTSFTLDYRSIMFDLSSGESCFKVDARRYNGAATGYESVSNTVCLETIESIYVPNAFTPDDNGLNDTFYPVIPFTPPEYLLVIRDKSGRIVFSSSDFQSHWNGTFRSSKLPPDVYLWYLRLKTPSGRLVEKTGSVALIYNQ